LLSTREGGGKEKGRVRKEIFQRGGVDGVQLGKSREITFG